MSKADEPAKEEVVPKTRVSEVRCIGLITEWRGYMGWIQPLTMAKDILPAEQATKHQGRIYLNQKDVAPQVGRKLKEGSIVDFFVYTDHDGLGAEDCQLRTVLRMTLPHSEVNKLTLTPQWSDYLGDSQYYPDFAAEHNVLLRKYTWSLPFALLELWGADADSLAKAAVHLAMVNKSEEKDEEKKEEKKEEAPECSLRVLVAEAAVKKVEALEGSHKVSAHAVVTTPTHCRSVTLAGSREKCLEATLAFMQATAPAAA